MFTSRTRTRKVTSDVTRARRVTTLTPRRALAILEESELAGAPIGALSASRWLGELVAWGVDLDTVYVPTELRADVRTATADTNKGN